MRESDPEASQMGCVHPGALTPEHSMAIGLGANLGNPVEQLCSARSAMEAALVPLGWRLWRSSSLYRSAPWETDGPIYTNAIIVWSGVPGDPQTVLEHLQFIELAAGRTRPYRYAPRTLDLDLLWCGKACIDTPTLTLPHPRLWERAFVVVPLAEVLDSQYAMNPARWGGPAGGWAAAISETAGQGIERMKDSAWDR